MSRLERHVRAASALLDLELTIKNGFVYLDDFKLQSNTLPRIIEEIKSIETTETPTL